MAEVFSSNDLSDVAVWTHAGTPTFTTGQHGTDSTAIDGLDGVDDLCYATTTLATEVAFSHFIWIKASTRSAYSVISTQYNGSAGANQFQFLLNATGKIEVYPYSGGGNAIYYTSISSAAFDDDTWHYVGFTVDATSCLLYVDGVAVALGTQTETGTYVSLGGTAAPLRIGTNHVATSQPGTGIVMGRPRAYNTKLSAGEVLTNYTAEVAAIVIPTATTTFLDHPNDGFTLSSVPTVTDGQHATSECYTYDGTDDGLHKAVTPISASSGADHSVGFWFKSTDATAVTFMVGQVNADAGAGSAWDVLMQSGKPTMYWFTDASNYDTTATVSTYNDGVWHHCLISQIATGGKLYIDGVDDSAATSPSGSGYSTMNSSVDDFSIGEMDGGTFPWAGTLARVKVYEGSAFSSLQASAEYTAEAAAVISAIPLLSHKYIMDETSGAMLDTVGSKDSDAPSSSPTYNGTSITLDGVDDSFDYQTANNPMDHTDSTSFYIMLKYLDDPDGVSLLHTDGSNSPTTFQQMGYWNDSASTNLFSISFGGSFGSVAAGREITNDEKIVSFFSYNKTSNLLQYVIKSDHATLPLDLTGSLAVGTDPNAQELYIGRNKANTLFINAELFGIGSIDGDNLSVLQMQASADELLVPAVVTGSTTGNIASTITSKIVTTSVASPIVT